MPFPTIPRGRKLLLLLAAAAAAVAVAVAVAAGITLLRKTPKLASYPDVVLSPFVTGSVREQAKTLDGIKQIAAKTSPLDLFDSAFKLLVQHGRNGKPEPLAQARRILDYMLTEYQPAERSEAGIRWMYGFDYDHGVKAPWWSGMDSLQGPMTFYAAWQMTGEPVYRDVAIKSALLAIRSPSEGGVLWREADGCWLSEFSWNGMRQDQELHVLNGHLWALQALYMLAEATGEPALEDAYQCAKRGTIARAEQFLNGERTWSWYQLGPKKVINTVDYHLLELTQFRALHALTGDKDFLPPLEERSRIMQKAYALTLKRSPSGGLSVLYPRVGAPHPYSSVPQPMLRCRVDGQEVVVRAGKPEQSESHASNVAIEMPVKAQPTWCQAAFHSTVENLIFEQREFAVLDEQAPPALHPGISVALDAIGIEGRTVTVSPRFKANRREASYENDEGRITLHMGDLPLGVSDQIVISLSPTASAKLGLIVQDDAGKTSMRYLMPLKAGEPNLIVLNRLGFPDNDALSSKIRTLSLRIFTDPTHDDFRITVDGVHVARNTVELWSLLNQTKAGHLPLDYL